MEIFAFLASDHERSCVLNRLNEERPPCKADAGLAINRRNSVVSATEKWPNQPPPHDDSTRAAVVFCVNGPHPAVADPTIDPVRRNVVVEARRKRQEQKTAERKSFLSPPPPPPSNRSFSLGAGQLFQLCKRMDESIDQRRLPVLPSGAVSFFYVFSFAWKGRSDATQMIGDVCVCVCVCVYNNDGHKRKKNP